MNENKISTKNAFELPLIEHMDDIVDSFMGGRKTKTKSDWAGFYVEVGSRVASSSTAFLFPDPLDGDDNCSCCYNDYIQP